MAAAMGNTVLKPGLVSTNPFLNATPKTGGTTTQQVAFPTLSPSTKIGNLTIPGQPTGATTTTSQIPFGNISLGNTPTPTPRSAPSSGVISPASPIGLGIGGGATPNVQIPSGTTQPNNIGSPYTAPTPSFGSTVGTEAQIAATSSPQYQAAQKAYLDAAEELQKLQTQAAEQNKNIGGSRTNLAEAGGEQGLLQNLVAGQEAALTGQMTAAQASAAAATGQQQTQQQGLLGAGGLLSPQLAGPTNVPYYPGQGYASPAASAFGEGGLPAVGGIQTQIQQGASVQQMTGQQAQAQALAKNLTGVITSAGINPATPGNASIMTNYVNGALQWINKNTGDPQYQNFANLINEISSRYASILNQSGGTPTDQSTLSHQIINSLASGQSILQVLSQLDKNASDSINALKGASQTNTAGGTAGGNVSAGGYNFIQNAQGQWTPA